MNMLQRVLVRDLWHMRGPLLAAACVVACGIAVLVAVRGTYQSLRFAQSDYYQSHRFADVFAHLKRAPQGLAATIRALPGVARAETRLVVEAMVDVPGLSEPAMARMVTFEGQDASELHHLQIVQGQAIQSGALDQVLVSQAFAEANKLRVGDRLVTLLHGRLKEWVIQGMALSPEFIYEVGNGMLFPDNRRYGVLWVPHEALAPAFDMQGAFNDVILSMSQGASEPALVDALNEILRDYGGLDAHGRDLQLSHRFLTDELMELDVMTSILPSLFLSVSAFLLYMVLSRLVATQRTQIGLLKAFGCTNAQVGLHYAGFAAATVLMGWLLGLPLGWGLGHLFVGVYRDFFHFPTLQFQLDPVLVGWCLLVSVVSASAGALHSVGQAVQLAPAEAMRPQSPATDRWSSGMFRWVRIGGAASVRMILRQLVRRPWRAMATILGMACAIGLMLVGRFAMDSPRFMLTVQFNDVQREDVRVTYSELRGPQAALSLSRLDGVMEVESFRTLPVWMVQGHRRKRITVMGLSRSDGMHQLLDSQMRLVALPDTGLALSTKLAQLLAVGPGDVVRLESLEGQRAQWVVPVTAVIDEMIGLGAYMRADAMADLLQEDHASSGALLRVRSDLAPALYAQLKQMAAIAGVALRGVTQQSLHDSMQRSFYFFSAILSVFAGMIVFGMVYNSARIALSERGKELACLSVLGFSQNEVLFLLLGEQAALLLVAIPVGWGMGYAWCAALVPMFDRDLFRVPLVIEGISYLGTAVVACAAAVLSGVLVARQVRQLDLIAVLKARE